MTKLEKMNEFLKYLDRIYRDNPALNKSAIYSLLVYYKASKDSINHLFDKWIAAFKNEDDIKVFVDMDWSYFCQFINGPLDEFRMIKLYIPLNITHIEEGAKIIFSFMQKQKMFHHSKIGTHLRNDNLVVRVHSIKDAKKIIDFVSNNNYLQEGMLEINPFVFNQNGIGLAMDANYSYNEVLSRALYNFFEMRKDKEITTPPNAHEFAEYLLQYTKYVNSKELLMIYSFIYLNIVNEKFSLDEFFDLVNRYQNNFSLLMTALTRTRDKYGDNQMMCALIAMLDNDFRYVTNDQNARVEAKRYLSSFEIKKMVNEVCGSNKKENISNEALTIFKNKFDFINQNISYNRVNDLIFALSETAKKYEGTSINEKYILQKFLETEDYAIFTRTNGARERIIMNFPLKNVKRRLQEDLGLDYSCDLDTIVSAVDRMMNFEEKKERNKVIK